MDRAVIQRIAHLGRDWLEGRLHREAFLDAVNTTDIPDLHEDEDVSELFALIYHGPALTLGWGKWMRAVHEAEVAEHKREVSRLIDRLLGR